MVQCEMCGTETASPNRVKIEGAELDVCDECTDFGTEVQTDSGTSSTSTKYSTDSAGSSDSGGSSNRSSGGSSSGGSGGRRRDMYDEMDEIAPDYDDRIRNARESGGLTQEELAKQLNEKASLIHKLERGDTLPSDEIQRKLERSLDISLTTSASTDDAEWESEHSSGGYTLGDVVERKDS